MTRGLQWLVGILLGAVVLMGWLSGGAPDASFDDGTSASISAEGEHSAEGEQRLLPDSDGLRKKPAEAAQATRRATSWEHELAILNADQYVAESDATVIRFRSLMRTNALQVSETEDEIAKLTLATWLILREEYGRAVGLLELMEDANRILYSQAGADQDYVELMSGFIETMPRR